MDSPRTGARGKRRPCGGSTGILVAVALLATLAVALVGWASLSGRLASLQYTNVPFVHRYPPQGMFVNPFTGDPRDLISVAEAQKVRSDFLQDGQTELDAFSRGDPAPLPNAETGRALSKARQVMTQNTAQGLVERDEVHIESVSVGFLADSNDSQIRWCVREIGHGAVVFASRSTGAVVSRKEVRFDSKYWLIQSGGRYLIADVLITTQPSNAGAGQ